MCISLSQVEIYHDINLYGILNLYGKLGWYLLYEIILLSFKVN